MLSLFNPNRWFDNRKYEWKRRRIQELKQEALTGEAPKKNLARVLLDCHGFDIDTPEAPGKYATDEEVNKWMEDNLNMDVHDRRKAGHLPEEDPVSRWTF